MQSLIQFLPRCNTPYFRSLQVIGPVHKNASRDHGRQNVLSFDFRRSAQVLQPAADVDLVPFPLKPHSFGTTDCGVTGAWASAFLRCYLQYNVDCVLQIALMASAILSQIAPELLREIERARLLTLQMQQLKEACTCERGAALLR